MSAPQYGPCEPWVTAEQIVACQERLPEPIKNLDPDELAEAAAIAAALATNNLYHLSGRAFPGACTITFHPCVGVNCSPAGDMWSPWDDFPSHPIRAGRTWQNIRDCSTCHVSCLRLIGPVTEVVSVHLDGIALTPEVDYKVSGNRRLCRIGAEWPLNTDPTLDPDEPGSFVIVYKRGRPIPTEAAGLAKVYALQLVMPFVCVDLGLCDRSDLEDGTISADGVTINRITEVDTDRPGRVGIKIVDDWLRVVNPNNRRTRTTVHSSSAFGRRGRGRRWTGTTPTP